MIQITPLQANILRRLRKRARAASDLGVRQSSVHTLLRRMEARGLVAASGKGQDRMWMITDDGNRTVDALNAAERALRGEG